MLVNPTQADTPTVSFVHGVFMGSAAPPCHVCAHSPRACEPRPPQTVGTPVHGNAQGMTTHSAATKGATGSCVR